jgi:hypothetical protein
VNKGFFPLLQQEIEEFERENGLDDQQVGNLCLTPLVIGIY